MKTRSITLRSHSDCLYNINLSSLTLYGSVNEFRAYAGLVRTGYTYTPGMSP